MTVLHAGEEPAEHRRFARYLQALEAVAEADEAAWWPRSCATRTRRWRTARWAAIWTAGLPTC
ncbi:hypothetical protein [Streptomyces sp. NBC_01579]|uniref:hypothetical protein n=1 Tax=Streptomyces sp. NBC_01579 TaxID=2975885 RepID=UPI003865CC71